MQDTQCRKPEQGKPPRRVAFRRFARSEDGASTVEFLALLAIALVMTALVTREIGAATDSVAQATGDEIATSQLASADGCAVTVAKAGKKLVEDC